MHLAWLHLSGFRNYTSLEMTPDVGINILIGPNGSGKTNVLEAIAYGSKLQSFRNSPDEALIGSDAEAAVVRLGVVKAAGEGRIEIEVPRVGRRRVLFNGKRPARSSVLATEFPVVAFLPDDLGIVKGGPAGRRDLIDDLAGQLTPTTAADIDQFKKILRQRNALLKQSGRSTDLMTLEVWDERLATFGARVLLHRLGLLTSLAPVFRESYGTVSSANAVLGWRYDSSWAAGCTPTTSQSDVQALLRDALFDRRDRDMDMRTTSVGPHRDEPTFLLDDRTTRNQASQGEQRSVALSLRLAAYHLLEERHGRPPVLLLDDVFSELDVARADGVMALMPRGQVFVSSAREDEVPVGGRRWSVSGGTVT
ncbi:MAG TPA: DNA replication/repair protein RecF [Actinobacteria bacterium]|nr:DNA replication and repair protein RecF [bacterium BMS3Bbin02]HDL41551.1 DNA replication/repair protein RecF [Actinomycetota bacterium]